VSEDRIAAGALFRAHATFVAGFLAKMGAARHDIDDLLQEVFLVAHRRGGFAPGAARATTWLAEISLRVLSTHRRTGRRRQAIADDEAVSATESSAPSPESVVASRAELHRLGRCLEALDVEHRAVFVLFELEAQSAAEIAAGLGLPIGTVHSRLFHARKRVLEAWRAGETP
jgi:RNA polymerase sigma-70 factor (ECF subfamily)